MPLSKPQLRFVIHRLKIPPRVKLDVLGESDLMWLKVSEGEKPLLCMGFSIFFLMPPPDLNREPTD